MSSLGAALACALLSSCGGGGGGSDTAPAVAAAPTTSVAAAAPPAPSPDPTPTAARTTPAADAVPTPAETIGTVRILSAESTVILGGVPEVPPPAAAFPTTGTSGRSFFVDSRSGDDRNDGRLATAGSNGVGPWKSLARVMQTDLGPGDTLVLACGSTWNETLRVPANGTAARPVLVTAPTAGCGSTARPTIDGSVAIPPGAWTNVGGSLWRATLAQAPLQLFATGGVMVEAYHPNRGYDATRPRSVFLPMAGNGDTITADGRLRSTTIATGPELTLPAGAAVTPGTRVRVRTNSWTIEERTITAHAAGKLTLDAHTVYPAVKDWGYYLVGQVWMVDSAGEWHFDATSQRLTAWMPNGEAPKEPVYATTLSAGADFSNRTYVSLDGLVVRRTGHGLVLRGSTGVQVRNATVEDVYGIGADLGGSSAAAVESSVFLRIGQDAITGVPGGTADASGMVVRDNVVRDSGVHIVNGAPATLPRKSYAAIYAGPDATVTGNAIVNGGYIGIRFMPRSTVQNNFVFGVCTVLDDCGGIYTWGTEANNSSVRSNTAVNIPGNRDGKPSTAGTQAVGIYLDDRTTGITVDSNTLADADHAIQVHNSRGNRITQNRLYGYRRSGIWLQNDSNITHPAGDVSGNVIEGNQIASALPGTVALWLDSQYGPTAAFARFDANRYLDRMAATVAWERTPAGQRALTLAQWRASSGIGSATAPDANASGASDWPTALYRSEGASLLPADMQPSSTANWTHWNQTAPSGSILFGACDPGRCLRYTPGGSGGLVSSPNFTLVQGRWYRVALDVLPDRPQQAVRLWVRRGGGGTNGYESLSDRDLSFTAAGGWQRHSAVFLATKTVNLRDPATGDLGARIDVEGLVPGSTISLANVELVQVVPDSAALLSALVANPGATAGSSNCPFPGSLAALCAYTRLLRDGQPVGWPMSLAPLTSEVIWVLAPGLDDNDRDGIPDSQDACPATAPGAVVNARGCALPGR